MDKNNQIANFWRRVGWNWPCYHLIKQTYSSLDDCDNDNCDNNDCDNYDCDNDDCDNDECDNHDCDNNDACDNDGLSRWPHWQGREMEPDPSRSMSKHPAGSLPGLKSTSSESLDFLTLKRLVDTLWKKNHGSKWTQVNRNIQMTKIASCIPSDFQEGWSWGV